jgi:hypothetical protein
MCKVYKVGDRTVPFGSTAYIALGIDILPSTETPKFLVERKV